VQIGNQNYFGVLYFYDSHFGRSSEIIEFMLFTPFNYAFCVHLAKVLNKVHANIEGFAVIAGSWV